MKRITKESVGTVFQITAIVFIFSYSSAVVKVGEQLNTVSNSTAVADYSAKLQQRIDSINNTNLYYVAKKKPVFFYTNVSRSITGSKK